MAEQKLGFMQRAARKLAMASVSRSVQNVYNQGRLIIRSESEIDYTEKDGAFHVWPVDEVAADLWSKMDAQARGQSNLPVAFVALHITPDDVKAELLKLPRQIKEG